MSETKAVDIEATPEAIEHIHPDKPQVVEDEDLSKPHMNYALVDKEVAQYASETIVEVDEATNKRLKRLIDKRILTVMVVTYFIQALDKGTMSFASIMGIITDTHMTSAQVRHGPRRISERGEPLTDRIVFMADDCNLHGYSRR